MIVLKVLLWIFLTLLGLLFLALVLPVCLQVEYKNENFTAKLRVLFFRFTLYPPKEEAPPAPEAEPPCAKAQEEPDAKPAKAKKKHKRSITVDDIVAMVSTAGAAMRIILRGIWFRRIRLVLPIAQESPDQTAIAYGKAQAYVGGVVATLRNFLNLHFKSVKIIADFNHEFTNQTYFYCNIVATPFIIVVAAIYAFFRLREEKVL